METFNKVLVIVPHCDDEVLMCGGTIRRLVRENKEVHVAFVRGPMDDRTKKQTDDAYKVQERLGYKQIHHLALSERTVANDFITFKEAIEELIVNVIPDTIITTFWGDNHQDHRETFRAVSVAARHHNAPSVKTILVGEINSSTDQNIDNNTFNPNYYIQLEETDITTKVKAMSDYDGEVREFPHPRSAGGILATAYNRGMIINHVCAEAFMCLKAIR